MGARLELASSPPPVRSTITLKPYLLYLFCLLSNPFPEGIAGHYEPPLIAYAAFLKRVYIGTTTRIPHIHSDTFPHCVWIPVSSLPGLCGSIFSISAENTRLVRIPDEFSSYFSSFMIHNLLQIVAPAPIVCKVYPVWTYLIFVTKYYRRSHLYAI